MKNLKNINNFLNENSTVTSVVTMLEHIITELDDGADLMELESIKKRLRFIIHKLQNNL